MFAWSDPTGITAEPRRGPIKATRSGTAQGCIMGSSPQRSVACGTLERARPLLPPLCIQAPRHGRRSSVTVRAWSLSPWAIRELSFMLLCVSWSSVPTRARVVPSAGTGQARPRAVVGASAPPTGRGRCHRRRSRNSDRRSCPDGRRIRGCWRSVNRAADS
jgi:hypothetical protein